MREAEWELEQTGADRLTRRGPRWFPIQKSLGALYLSARAQAKEWPNSAARATRHITFVAVLPLFTEGMPLSSREMWLTNTMECCGP